jgi:hypothetical protein
MAEVAARTVDHGPFEVGSMQAVLKIAHVSLDFIDRSYIDYPREEAEQMAKITVDIETVAGFPADKRPLSFTLAGRTFQVRELLDIIRHDTEEDAWEMVMMEAGEVKQTAAGRKQREQ